MITEKNIDIHALFSEGVPRCQGSDAERAYESPRRGAASRDVRSGDAQGGIVAIHPDDPLPFVNVGFDRIGQNIDIIPDVEERVRDVRWKRSATSQQIAGEAVAEPANLGQFP